MNTQGNNVYIGKEAVELMSKGIKVATDALRISYGPKGVNASVPEHFYPYSSVSNDAQTIVQAIKVSDPIQERGLNYIKELCDKADKDSKDGRKTTCIIADEILKLGSESELSGLVLKEELDALIPVIEKSIDDQKEEINVENVWKVASIAGQSETRGKLLGKIFERIGKDGIILPEPSGTYETSCEFIEGVRFTGAGYLSPYMVYEEDKRKLGQKEIVAEYLKPTILVTKRKISHSNDITPLLDRLQAMGQKDLVIFTDDMDSGVASMLVNTHKEKVMNILIIKAPVLWKNYVFEDFAKVTGSTILEDATGVTFKNLQMGHLGTCDKITVDADETRIISSIDISEHINALKKDGNDDSRLRLSWLATKTAILKLGANNESELSYIRKKVDDAIASSFLALNSGGVVDGGGVALLNASLKLPDTVAGRILKKALSEPVRQIMENGAVPVGGTDDKFSFGENVIDAAKVVKNAVRNAVSLASTVLTTPIVIVFPPKTPEQIAAEALQANRMRF